MNVFLSYFHPRFQQLIHRQEYLVMKSLFLFFFSPNQWPPSCLGLKLIFFLFSKIKNSWLWLFPKKKITGFEFKSFPILCHHRWSTSKSKFSFVEKIGRDHKLEPTEAISNCKRLRVEKKTNLCKKFWSIVYDRSVELEMKIIFFFF